MATSKTAGVREDERGNPMERAVLSLEGLSLGDAFGERFFAPAGIVRRWIEARRLPDRPWRFTDDTAMAISILETLAEHGGIDPDFLAARFAERFVMEPRRGYGGGAIRLLCRLAEGADWRQAAGDLFGGEGSMGNGSAMRVGPIGAYFADDLDRVVVEARLSAAVTHAHPEGVSGAVAVAVATARTWQLRGLDPGDAGRQLMTTVLDLTPPGPTREGLVRAAELPVECSATQAADALGNGSRVCCPDTVPFCIWCAARHVNSFEDALWTTVSALGDRDTTCAIVGAIVAMRAGRENLPPQWLECREPLPEIREVKP